MTLGECIARYQASQRTLRPTLTSLGAAHVAADQFITALEQVPDPADRLVVVSIFMAEVGRLINPPEEPAPAS